MVFSSLTFLYVFLPVCLLFYFITNKIKVRNIVLLIFSLVFYSYGEPTYILLLVATVLLDYVCGLLIDKFKGKLLSKVFVAIAIVITISSLGLFKYFNLFSNSLNSVFGLNIPILAVALPIGISFYTFQALTYVVDVYRGNVSVQKSFFKLLLYVSMFPQLIAGPIVRYSDVDRQLDERTVTFKGAASGIVRFCVGLLKKTVIANFSGELCTKLIGGEMSTLSSVGAFFGIFAFAIQIYFDFSGYSDMAIGLGKVFGFDFPENFNFPYCASSIQDFWRRWHITLTSFFRDYLYIPLGGNRKHWAYNMLIVWVLTGFWHGASWNYLLWGLYYFFFLMLEKMYIGKYIEKWNPFFQHLYTIVVVLFGWTFFYFEDMTRLYKFFKALFFMNNGFITLSDKTMIVNYLVILLIGVLASMPFSRIIKRVSFNLSDKQAGKIVVNVFSILFVVASLFVSTASMVGNSYNPFLYFRF